MIGSRFTKILGTLLPSPLRPSSGQASRTIPYQTEAKRGLPCGIHSRFRMPYPHGVRARWVFLTLGLFAAGAALWLRFEPVRALRRLAPTLSPAMAEHLVRGGDDTGFSRFALEVGVTELRESFFAIGRSIDYSSPEAYVRTAHAVEPYRRRLAVAMAELYFCPDYLRDLEFRANLPPERAIALRELIAQESQIGSNRALSPTERIRRYEALLEQFRAFGYMRGVVLVEERLAAELPRLGRSEETLLHLRRAVAAARALGETFLMCGLLGTLGVAYHSHGHIDSMHACFDEALAIARRSRFPDQFSRILEFQAGYQIERGRLAVATDMIIEAQRQCREMGGGGLEIRFVAGAMDHFAELGCWEIVERLLEHCPVLIRDLEGSSSRGMYEVYRLSAERTRIGLHLARGSIAEAIKLMKETEQRYRAPSNPPYAALLEKVSGRLIEAGRPLDALPWIETGLAYCDSFHLPEYGTPLALRLAQARFANNALASARAALQDFDRRTAADRSGDHLVARDVLDARLLVHEGNPVGARDRLDRAVAVLRKKARTLDAGPQGYLALSAHNDLRDAKHQMLARAADGYRFELEWRSLFTELGRGHEIGAIGLVAPSRPPDGAYHCVYRFGSHAIMRWTSTSQGVTHDTLDIPAADCRREIAGILEGISRRGLAPAFHARLHRLGRALLPATVLSGGSGMANRTLLITPDGPLRQLPFELLNLSATGFEPLMQRWDVAYGDRPGRRVPRRSGPAVILADPLPAPELRRTIAPGTLREARVEAESVRRAWPGSRFFEGPGAIKPAVLASWREASRIHVAAHLMRDPEIPFLAYFPMAKSAPDAPADDSYLEMADIRATDLSGCELVVLSACASGAPYVASGNRIGPSMGDAFLDAGAHAVIQTLWPVEDAEARRFVERFVKTWKPGNDPVAALAAARRAAQGDGEPPWVWGAWSIHLAGAPWSNDDLHGPGRRVTRSSSPSSGGAPSTPRATTATSRDHLTRSSASHRYGTPFGHHVLAAGYIRAPDLNRRLVALASRGAASESRRR